jgi:hypothetical protein
MPIPFAIDQRLSHADLAAFRELMGSRYLTIDAAQAWLADRGYKISHGAVQRYLRRARSLAVFPLPSLAGLDDDAKARQQLALWAGQLRGDYLSRLALTAFYLLSTQAAQQGGPSADISGTVTVHSMGDRAAVDGPAV